MSDAPTPAGPPLPHSDRLTISPSLSLVMDDSQAPTESSLADVRVLQISALAIGLGVCAAGASVVLVKLIALITNLSFFHRFSFETAVPAGNQLGGWVVVIPVIGALIVGFMARYGSKAIRGHGIPEAMEQVLTNESRIPARMTFLKPISAAVSIGTGGPFGAEGPIIATGGALGSVLGQFLSTTASERKTLLAAGAAAGMAATFGSPVSAVLLAIELLLFEYRARSIIPVALASAVAAGIRLTVEGSGPVFAAPELPAPALGALACYALLGCLTGGVATLVTRLVYAIEDAFERLPIHWMWWPALGAIVVGFVGYFAPDTLGVGYYNISALLGNQLTTRAIFVLCVMKFISWSIALGSGTSGGTLAPLFTIGAGVGSLIGIAVASLIPGIGMDVHTAAIVGMAAMFAGASRAFLASAVFAFETTLEPNGILPLLMGCTTAYLASCILMRNTIMTEKISRRGIRAPAEYTADMLERVSVREVTSQSLVVLKADDTIRDVQRWVASGAKGSSHQGFPVLDSAGHLVGVLTRRDILDGAAATRERVRELIHRLPKFVYDDCTVRQAADHMANHGIGRLPVVTRLSPPRVVGIITRSDILACYRRNLDDHRRVPPTITFALPQRRTG